MDAKLKRKVWERDDYCCQHPGCGTTLVDTVPHHIIYRSQGGKDEESNLVTLCRCHHTLAHNERVWRRHWEAWKEERLV